MVDQQDDSGIEQDNQLIYIRISVEDHHLQKVLKFNLDDTIWKAKQKIFQVLIKELPDSLNYGLYLPAYNGRAGKFLDESRCLKEYPLNGPVSYLELKYKRRVYKSIDILQKHFHLKLNPKKFLELIQTNQVAKVARYLEKGFDPNYHISDYETPLICACINLLEPRSMIMTLVNGGAHLDFRTRKQGLTPLHQSAKFSRKEAIITLLELGASANVYDENNLTPLYLTLLTNETNIHIDSSYCCLLLLRDHSIINIRDKNESTELHQCCRLGLVQHLEHLLFYRCEIDSIDIQGNTPLHICAMTNQENCARILLYRGANLHIKNHSNQTAYDLSLIYKHRCLAKLIESHRIENVVPFVDYPLVNPKRRSILFDRKHSRGRSSSITNSSSLSSTNNRSISMPKLNSSTFQQQIPSSRSQSPKSSSLNSDQGFSSQSNSHLSLNSPNQFYYTSMRKRLYSTMPGRTSLCIQSYQANLPGELSLNKGDIIQILSIGEDGFVEGIANGHQGWVPINHLQDISILKEELVHDEQFNSRTIVLQKGRKGFGFVLRGSRIAGKYFQPTASHPALQFLDSIEKGSNADKAGLKQNDYVLEINGINVISMPHEDCVQLIKRSGDTLTLKVMTSFYKNHLSFSKNNSLKSTNHDDFDGRLTEYDYGSIIVPLQISSEDNLSLTKKLNENFSSESNEIKIKPLVPSRDSSLYDSNSIEKVDHQNSNSSSNEGDEEYSLTSLNSNEIQQAKSSFINSMLTFKKHSQNEQSSSLPPDAPPLPHDFQSTNSNENQQKNDFQCEIEQAKTRLKKVEESNSKECIFPPPPSPRTLRRPTESTKKIADPRLDVNFSAVIAQRAAESKARRHENPFGLEFNSNGLPPATTFFNNCVTTNLPINVKCTQRFSTTANQLLENLKRRNTNSSSSSRNTFTKN